jgi:hypothetical protein
MYVYTYYYFNCLDMHEEWVEVEWVELEDM